MYQLSIPTEIIFGHKCVSEKGNLIKNYGTKALIVTGKNSARVSGALEDILEVLEAIQMEYVLFEEVIENPEIEIINKGITICQEFQCNLVIAIGGGSPIDAAKAISIGSASNITGTDLFIVTNHIKAHPIIAIPTTSGTGSEVTQYSVLTDAQNKKKAGFGSKLMFPSIAFLDSSYTLSLSVRVTRDTAIDALSHLLEGLYSKLRNPLFYPLIYEGVKLIYKNLEQTLHNPSDIQLRTKLMQASLYGGMVIS